MTSKRKAIREGKRRWAQYKAEKKACLTPEEKKAFSIAYKAGIQRWRQLLAGLEDKDEIKYQKQIYFQFMKRRYMLPALAALLVLALAAVGCVLFL